MKHIIWQPKTDADPRIMQVYHKGLEYAFYSKDNKQATSFVFCKDFLQDTIYSVVNHLPINIYKFSYRPDSEAKVTTDKTRLLLTNSKDRNLPKKIPVCLDFINQIESHLKIKKTTVRECYLPPIEYKKCGVWAFEGSHRWLLSPPMISLYSLFLRVGFVHTIGDDFKKTIHNVENKLISGYQTKDYEQLRHGKEAIAYIFETGDRKIFSSKIKKNYPVVGIETMHHMLGVVGFSNQMRNKNVMVQHWVKEK